MNLPIVSDLPIDPESTYGGDPNAIQPQALVTMEHVGVRYRVPAERLGTFKEYIIRWLQRRVQHRDFWALSDLSLQIYSGEFFGIVGHNGAGKSTLLKLIARVLRPSTGRVVVRGHVAPLLELGAGFHPELTGRENVYLNGALLGFSRHQMDEKFKRIIDFAELGSFIDAPMRTYSSGMWARLGFAVATDVNPDILLVDEVLAVGDESFQRKSLERMQNFQKNGAAIILVSHNLGTIESMCHRVAWLHHGQIRMIGPAAEVVEAYRSS